MRSFEPARHPSRHRARHHLRAVRAAPRVRAPGPGAGRRADPRLRLLEPGRARAGHVRLDGRRLAARPADAATRRSGSRCAPAPCGPRASATDFLPPSPAHDAAAYERFVRALVAHGRGRVQYWQCENEPSNTDLLWAGTADGVRRPPPRRSTGRCGRPIPTPPSCSAAAATTCCRARPTARPWQFFDRVLDGGPDAFDLFAVHLYDDPTRIPAHVETVRRMMRDHGDERPVVVGEYNGPTLFELPRARRRSCSRRWRPPSPAAPPAT